MRHGHVGTAALDSDASDEQLATLPKLSERYCVIFQTLRTPPRLSATLQRGDAVATLSGNRLDSRVEIRSERPA